ncbi:MAG: hypothetical protein HY898_06730 [Deltaproteobacteria bacterium]|nr:hypothetical protein [Deltaproteobacteria bacterium]
MKHTLLFILGSAVLVLGGCMSSTQSSLAGGETAPANRDLSLTVDLETGRVRVLDPVALQRNEAEEKR